MTKTQIPNSLTSRSRTDSLVHRRRSEIFRALVAVGFGLATAGVLVLATASAALAVEEESDEGIVYKKKTVVSFEDDTIDGDLTRPDVGFVESRKRVRHSNLIRIREDFRAQILNSVTKL